MTDGLLFENREELLNQEKKQQRERRREREGGMDGWKEGELALS